MTKFIILFFGSLIILYIWFKIYKIIESKNKEESGWKTDFLFISSLIIVVIFGVISMVSVWNILKKILTIIK